MFSFLPLRIWISTAVAGFSYYFYIFLILSSYLTVKGKEVINVKKYYCFFFCFMISFHFTRYSITYNIKLIRYHYVDDTWKWLWCDLDNFIVYQQNIRSHYLPYIKILHSNVHDWIEFLFLLLVHLNSWAITLFLSVSLTFYDETSQE